MRLTTYRGLTVTLAEDNAALMVVSGAKATDEMKAIYKTAQEHIVGEGILEKALGVGDTVPMFELPDADGQMVSLADVLARDVSLFSDRLLADLRPVRLARERPGDS